MHLEAYVNGYKWWVSPYLQAKQLSFHSFTGIGKSHEIPGSETKEFIAHSAARGTKFMYSSVFPSHSHPDQVPGRGHWGAWVDVDHMKFMS